MRTMKEGRAAIAVCGLLILVPACLAVSPGFRTVFTNKGLDYIRQVGIPLLERRLSSISIPDVSGHASIHIVVKVGVDYSLTDIQLSNLQIPTSSLTTGSSGLTLKSSGISMHMSANWKYKETGWPHIKDHGSCDVSVSGVSISVMATVGVDTNGHATLSASGCSFDVGHLGVKFHGGASWIYNLFDNSIASKIKDKLQSQVCQEATNAMNTAGDKALESLPVVIKLNEIAEINYAFLEAPKFTSTYIETQHKGEIFSVTDPVEAPFSPLPLPSVADTDTRKMAYVWITDYVANTAGLVYQKAGELQYSITPDMIPSKFPFQLNTNSFKLFVPQLYSKYPNMPVTMQLKSVKPPALKVVPGSADLTGVGQVEVYVMNPNKTTELAFTIGVVLHCDVVPWISFHGSKEAIKANTTFVSAELSLVGTNIGNFSVVPLQTAAKLLSTAFIIPTLNRYGSIGLPLPVIDGISFINTTINLGQGYALIGTDFNYHASFLA